MQTVRDLFGEEYAIVKQAVKKKTAKAALLASLAKEKRREPVFADVVKITPHYSVLYSKEISGFFGTRGGNMPKINTPVFGMSDRSARRLGSALNWMILFSTEKKVHSIKEKRDFKFRIGFITLTLSDTQKHTDHEIKQHMLAPFLKWLERSHNCQSYIWKAESQDNGNIHFHITVNQFVHWKSIRAKWNRLLANHGYCKVFQDGTNDKGNAATQIKAVKTMKGIVSYMQSYITKKDVFKFDKRKKTFILSETCPLDDGYYTKTNYRQMHCSDGKSREYKRQIEGKNWSTSHNLAKINCFIDQEADGYFSEAREQMLQKSELLFFDRYVTIRKHSMLNSKQLHPLWLEKLKEVKANHFSENFQPKRIEIESFY
jgi:hypothetical protein